jgi:hypothetical protein
MPPRLVKGLTIEHDLPPNSTSTLLARHLLLVSRKVQACRDKLRQALLFDYQSIRTNCNCRRPYCGAPKLKAGTSYSHSSCLPESRQMFGRRSHHFPFTSPSVLELLWVGGRYRKRYPQQWKPSARPKFLIGKQPTDEGLALLTTITLLRDLTHFPLSSLSPE